MQMHVNKQHLLNIDHTMYQQDLILLLVLFGFLQKQISLLMTCSCPFVHAHQHCSLCKQLQSVCAVFQSMLLAFS